MKITVEKVTSKKECDEACSMTIFGNCKPPLRKMYAAEHSPIRTQLFSVKCYNIPLFVATHLVRHHVGSTPFEMTYRSDRNKKSKRLSDYVDELKILTTSLINKEISEDDFKNKQDELLDTMKKNTDRYTPTNLMLFVNAQGLIDMAQKRLCTSSSVETRKVFKEIRECVKTADIDLYPFLVPTCIYRNGICPEFKKCGYNKTEKFKTELKEYLKNF